MKGTPIAAIGFFDFLSLWKTAASVPTVQALSLVPFTGESHRVQRCLTLMATLAERQGDVGLERAVRNRTISPLGTRYLKQAGGDLVSAVTDLSILHKLSASRRLVDVDATKYISIMTAFKRELANQAQGINEASFAAACRELRIAAHTMLRGADGGALKMATAKDLARQAWTRFAQLSAIILALWGGLYVYNKYDEHLMSDLLKWVMEKGTGLMDQNFYSSIWNTIKTMPTTIQNWVVTSYEVCLPTFIFIWNLATVSLPKAGATLFSMLKSAVKTQVDIKLTQAKAVCALVKAFVNAVQYEDRTDSRLFDPEAWALQFKEWASSISLCIALIAPTTRSKIRWVFSTLGLVASASAVPYPVYLKGASRLGTTVMNYTPTRDEIVWHHLTQVPLYVGWIMLTTNLLSQCVLRPWSDIVRASVIRVNATHSTIQTALANAPPLAHPPPTSNAQVNEDKWFLDRLTNNYDTVANIPMDELKKIMRLYQNTPGTQNQRPDNPLSTFFGNAKRMMHEPAAREYKRRKNARGANAENTPVRKRAKRT